MRTDMLVTLFAAVALSSPAPPPPDPDPSACHAGWCPVITFVAYDIDVPAVSKATGKVVPGVFFTCHVPVRWHGKPNRWGHSVCKIKRP